MLFLPRLALGGDEEIRTLDPLLAGQVLSQLSYTPMSSMGPEQSLKIEQQQTHTRIPLNTLSRRLYLWFCSTVYLRYPLTSLVQNISFSIERR